jgi:dihydroorotate dehydrogenase electron transfer subunit
MSKVILDCQLVTNQELSPLYHLLEFRAPATFPKVFPGQFAEILVPNAPHTFLRRPFSVYDADEQNHIIKFIIKIAGEGTRLLCSMKAGEIANILFPLGKGFTLPAGKALVVGGGVGIAPMFLLSRWLNDHGFTCDILLGGRSKADIINTEEFSVYGKLGITTDDGSLGHHGIITTHPWLQKIDPAITRIYTCGPEPMMRAVAAIAVNQNVDCEVSLENTMACGYGVCLSCIVATDEGNICTCTEGPVFNTKILKDWNNPPVSPTRSH